MLEGTLRALHDGALLAAQVALALLLPATSFSFVLAMARGSERAADALSILAPSSASAVLVCWALERGTAGAATAVGFVGAAFAWRAAFGAAKRVRGDA